MLFAQLVIDTASVLVALGVIVTAFGLLYKQLIGSKDDLVRAEKDRADAAEKRGQEIAESQRLLDKERFATEKAESERLYKELESVKKSYEDIAAEGVRSYRQLAANILRQQGGPPLETIAPVISESQSPSTEAQREAARIATMRATMAQVKKAVGQEAREEPARLPDEQDPSTPDDTLKIKVDEMQVGKIILDNPENGAKPPLQNG